MLVGKVAGPEPEKGLGGQLVCSKGGSNEVIIPSGERTNPWEPLLSLYEPVIAPSSLMLKADVNKLPGTSNDTIFPPARRTKPKLRPLAV
jgi:hypothetical protein